MATGDYHFPSLDLRVPKRRRTERPRSPPPSGSGLTEDEKECILALLALSRVPVIHDDQEMTPAEEARYSLLRMEEEDQSQSLPLPSSSPPKQQQEVPPISPPSLSQQDQPVPQPPPAERDLSPLPPQQNQPLPLPPPAERALSPLPPKQNQPLPLRPPPEQALSLVLCPMPIRCYRPPLPPPPPPIQRPTPFVYMAPTQQNQLRYVCSECGKAFSSYQALGGHKTKHRKRPAENSAAASAASVVTGSTDQSKPHTCSLCHKSFETGQALGGHMRAHYERNKRQATADSRPVAAAPSSSMTECSTTKGLGIDLNQPPKPEADWATEEEAASSQPAAAATSQPPRFFNFFF
ncbi:serine/arginine repetitive matrix protein 1-like [Zingiber officinale]|uniref:C2H2-type domain-containing protein n=1 Tax=Zingiber officinale TaxID=94328 RepID=A0A8J5KGW4_ZINOF|nr:serine/arginine repetitive matrix protein 1-like [Zingiber officinale]KAG6489660.1 hypothetical protein ZIOFF_050936 [Zingiber officinale]